MNSNEQRDYLTPGANYAPPLPNATISLLMGILSIVICGVGLVLGIVGIIIANKDLALYKSAPATYSIDSYKNTKTGRICSIIGIILSSLIIVVYAILIIAALTANLNDLQSN
jgi:hypothetical protein